MQIPSVILRGYLTKLLHSFWGGSFYVNIGRLNKQQGSLNPWHIRQTAPAAEAGSPPGTHLAVDRVSSTGGWGEMRRTLRVSAPFLRLSIKLKVLTVLCNRSQLSGGSWKVTVGPYSSRNALCLISAARARSLSPAAPPPLPSDVTEESPAGDVTPSVRKPRPSGSPAGVY